MILKCFRMLGWLEGLSLLALLFVAMPLKYVWHIPEAVRVIGMTHGVLFMMYGGFAFLLFFEQKWSKTKLVLALVLSVIPLGTFIFEKKIL